MIATNTPRIYVASLSDYNAGRLHGAWIDLEPGMDVDDLREKIAGVLARSPEPLAEEWAIHDYDSFPDLGEYPSLDQIIAIADALNEAIESGAGDAFRAWIAGDSYRQDNPEQFHGQYVGTYDNAADYAYQCAEESGLITDIPDTLAGHIDWDGYGRDLLMGLETADASYGIYVFDPNA